MTLISLINRARKKSTCSPMTSSQALPKKKRRSTESGSSPTKASLRSSQSLLFRRPGPLQANRRSLSRLTFRNKETEDSPREPGRFLPMTWTTGESNFPCSGLTFTWPIVPRLLSPHSPARRLWSTSTTGTGWAWTGTAGWWRFTSTNRNLPESSTPMPVTSPSGPRFLK
jgi:hypothetical protein